MFKLETHCHTSEVSGYSRLPAVQLVTQLKRSGYGGAVITDHFHHGYFDSLTGSWTQKIDCFLSGYRAAREAGAQAGLHIYCGLEFRTTTSDNDYLLFGAAPELLYSTPELHRYTIPQLRALADREGLLLVQAHPFRTGLTREDPALLDGVEVFNGNARHDSHNDDALRFARENGLLFFPAPIITRPRTVDAAAWCCRASRKMKQISSACCLQQACCPISFWNFSRSSPKNNI